jgi:hypothetical protein
MRVQSDMTPILGIQLLLQRLKTEVDALAMVTGAHSVCDTAINSLVTNKKVHNT